MRIVFVPTFLVLTLLGIAGSTAAQDVGTPAPVAPASPSLAEGSDISGRNFAGALVDAFKLLAIEHGFRIAFQEKTRAELEGPFWQDYRRSVRIPRQWDDTDLWPVNYVGHPIHGAAAGIIWLDHSEKDKASSLWTKGYLASRGRAAAFSAIYSVQFEIGPLSEASIGNVGIDSRTAGWVDYVVTPVGAFGFMLAEDALDRYLVRWIEGRVGNRTVRAIVRLVFGPSRFLANVAQVRLPWYRHDRPLGP